MRHSTALPVAYVFLRILILLNWVFAGCVFALLVFTFVNEAWTMKALGVTGMSDAVQVMWAMRGIATYGSCCSCGCGKDSCSMRRCACRTRLQRRPLRRLLPSASTCDVDGWF